MNKRLKILLPVVFAVFLAAGIYVGSIMNAGNSVGNLFNIKYTEKEKLTDVINFISTDYVDSVDKTELTEKTIEKLLGSLDPHSSYIPPRELDAVEESINGNFFGIGIQFRQWHDTIVVVRVIENGPATKAGIEPGDRLISADGISLVKLDNDSIMRLLKGPRGSRVSVSAYRPSDKTIHRFTITRGVIPYESITSYYLVNDSTAYLKIDRFAATTYDEFLKAVRTLGLNSFKNIIIDLQNNGGGLLTTAEALTDEFLPEGKIIVYTEGRNREKEVSYSTSKELMKGKNVYVLVNESSASASEIFAGAIQDNDRGTIIGRRTFGKGLVQEQITLADKSAIRLTVARYYTATGRCIQKPYDKGTDDYYHEITQRYLHGEMTNADSAMINDSLMFKTEKGKTVYGGGGIMPDVYVPLDTTMNYLFYNKLQRSGVFDDFAFEYFDKNRLMLLKKYPGEKDFAENFTVTAKIMRDLLKAAKDKGIEPYQALPDTMLYQIKVSLKARIASDLYGSNAYYIIINKTNQTFNKAVNYITFGE
jgi:carboxyl-terminal processing protease